MILRNLLSRSPKNISQSQPFPPEHREARFLSEEHHRTQLFEQSRRQQQYEFAATSQTWLKGEDERNATFKQALSDAEKELEQQAAEHLRRFAEHLEKFDQSATSNNDIRWTLVKEARDTRLDVFKQEQGRREDAVSKLVSRWEDSSEKGSAERRIGSGEVMEQYRKQFQDMIRGVQEAFEEAQAGRDVFVAAQHENRAPFSSSQPLEPTVSTQDIAVADTRKSTSHSDVPPVGQAEEATGIPEHNSLLLSKPAAEQYTPWLDVPVPELEPVTGDDQDALSGEPLVPVVSSNNPSSTLQPERYDGPQDLSSYTPNPTLPATFSKPPLVPIISVPQGNPEIPSTVTLRSLDTDFTDREDRRRAIFAADEKERATFFSCTEEFLQMAAKLREEQIASFESHMHQYSSDISKFCLQMLDARRAEYDRSGNRRTQAYDDAAAYMDAAFRTLIHVVDEECTALKDAADHHLACCFAEIEYLNEAQREVVQQLRGTFNAQFSASFVTLADGLDASLPQPPAAGTAPTESYAEEGELAAPVDSRLDPRAVIGALGSVSWGGDAPDNPFKFGHIDRWRRPWPRTENDDDDNLFALEESTEAAPTGPIPGFVPFGVQTLLQAPQFREGLPVSPARPAADRLKPQAITQVSQVPSHSSPFRSSKYSQRHDLLFLKSEALRASLFNAQMHVLHRSVGSKEMNAQLSFKTQLQAFQQRFTSHKLAQTSKFQRLLSDAGKTFSEQEAAREAAFIKQVSEWRTAFEGEQRSRHFTFAEKLRQVQYSFVDEEYRRQAAFTKWREEKMYEIPRQMAQWRVVFANDEQERLRVFKASLSVR